MDLKLTMKHEKIEIIFIYGISQ